MMSDKKTWTRDEWMVELDRMNRVRQWPYKRIQASFRKLLRAVYDLLPEWLKN